MKEFDPQTSATGDIPAPRRGLLPWLLAGGCLLAILAGFLFPPIPENSSIGDSNQTTAVMPLRTRSVAESPVSHLRKSAEARPAAAEIVAGKLSQFARNRHEIVQAMAAQFKVEIPEDVQRYF